MLTTGEAVLRESWWGWNWLGIKSQWREGEVIKARLGVCRHDSA